MPREDRLWAGISLKLARKEAEGSAQLAHLPGSGSFGLLSAEPTSPCPCLALPCPSFLPPFVFLLQMFSELLLCASLLQELAA